MLLVPNVDSCSYIDFYKWKQLQKIVLHCLIKRLISDVILYLYGFTHYRTEQCGITSYGV